MITNRVALRIIEDDEGRPMARLTFSDVAFLVDPAHVSYLNGELRIRVPAWIDVPGDAVIIERWLPPTIEQVRLAVEALDPVAVERVLLREQQANPDESWGSIARRAVAYAAIGDGMADGDD